MLRLFQFMMLVVLAASFGMLSQPCVLAEEIQFHETEDDVYEILSVEPRGFMIDDNYEKYLPSITTDAAYKKFLLDLGVKPARLEFKLNSSELTEETQKTLKKYARVLKERLPQAKVIVAGHADTKGSDATNLRISLKRAQAVADYLIRKQGLAATRFIISGFGEMSPLEGIPSTDPRNRRVEFVRIP